MNLYLGRFGSKVGIYNQDYVTKYYELYSTEDQTVLGYINGQHIISKKEHANRKSEILKDKEIEALYESIRKLSEKIGKCTCGVKQC